MPAKYPARKLAEYNGETSAGDHLISSTFHPNHPKSTIIQHIVIIIFYTPDSYIESEKFQRPNLSNIHRYAMSANIPVIAKPFVSERAAKTLDIVSPLVQFEANDANRPLLGCQICARRMLVWCLMMNGTDSLC
jgi:hypothetical protein